MINSLANGIWPEFSSAFGAGNLSLARKFIATLIRRV